MSGFCSCIYSLLCLVDKVAPTLEIFVFLSSWKNSAVAYICSLLCLVDRVAPTLVIFVFLSSWKNSAVAYIVYCV